MAYWSPVNERKLIALWSEGKTGTEIAVAMRWKFSRSAVIAKARRLNLSRRPSPLHNQKKSANLQEE